MFSIEYKPSDDTWYMFFGKRVVMTFGGKYVRREWSSRFPSTMCERPVVELLCAEELYSRLDNCGNEVFTNHVLSILF